MDIQHEMALIIAKQITKMEFEMKEDKFNILVYGIEVFLNEAIKVVVIVCLGILMDKLRLIILRRYVGGNHFSNNKICLLYSVTSTTIIPVLVEKIEIVYYDMFFLLIIEIIVLFIFVERRKNESEKQLLIRKMKGAIIFISIFVWGNLVGKKQYVFVVECIMATIELMLYKKNKKFY